MARRRARWSVGAAVLCLGVAGWSLADSWRAERATRDARLRLAASDRPAPLLLTPVTPAAGPVAPLPVAEFATADGLARWVAGSGVEAARVEAPGRPGRWAARVAFPLRSLEGLTLSGLPRDWRPYRALALEVYAASPRPGLALGVRIDDRLTGPAPSPRFERAVPLGAGWNRMDLETEPIGRAIDLSAVRRLILYARGAEDDPAARTLVVSAVTLVP